MTPTGYIATVTPHTQAVNIRERASTGSRIVGTLRLGRSMPVLVVGAQWVRVDHVGAEAFIARHIVTIEMDE